MDTTTQQALSEVQDPTNCEDWGSKVQSACEAAWHALSVPAAVIEARDFDLLISLLRKEDALSVAQQVIPELRRGGGGINITSPHQRRIVDAIRPTVAAQPMPPPRNIQDSYETPVSRAEKRAYYDADNYRTRLFLRQHDALSSEQKMKMEQWLKDCPVKIEAGDIDEAATAAAMEHERMPQ